jgi:2-amino-4-hydroxy-6-hydroxymethyldihydropteridine diphosphokinase
MVHQVVLGLGANLGDAESSLDLAIDMIQAHERVDVVACSSLYRTSPVGGPDQPDFYNAIIKISTELSPEQVLALARDIETRFNRVREQHWGPRTMDVDVIAYDDLISSDPELTLPHPRAHERAFVLVPWLEVDASASLATMGPIADLMSGVKEQGIHKVEQGL